MYTWEIVNLINKQNGNLTQEQYLDVYDHSPQISAVFLNDGCKYEYEIWTKDKDEGILFNVVTEFEEKQLGL